MKMHPVALALVLFTPACGDFVEYDDAGFGDDMMEGDSEGEPGRSDDGAAGGDGGAGGADGGGHGGGDPIDCDDCNLVPGFGGDDEDDGHDDSCDDGRGDGVVVECVPVETVLVAGQHFDAGAVTINTSEDELVVEVKTLAPWSMNMIHIYAGREAPTHNPGSFPFASELSYDEEFSLPIDLSDLRVSCGDTVYVAVHAEVTKPLDRYSCQEETAWGEGEVDFEQGWGSYLEVTICCD